MNEASPAAGPRPWRPSLFMQVGFGLHAGAAGLLLASPERWPLALGALAACHVAITAAGMWPRSRLLGPNLLRLTASQAAAGSVALTLDDGPHPEVTPQVLDLLDRHQARATFFCVGRKVEEHAAVAQEIVRRGHDIGNHTYGHSNAFAFNGAAGMRREIERAQQAIERATGRVPQLFRAPAGIRNPFLEPVLCGLGLHLTAWTRRGFDTVTGDPARVAARLTRGLRAGDILLLHDGRSASDARGRPVILEALPRVLDALGERGLRSEGIHLPPDARSNRGPSGG